MICIPIVAHTTEDAVERMARCVHLADMIELRLDALIDVDMHRIFAAAGERLLVTNRKHDEGGHFTGSEEDRIDLLCRAVALGANYVDVEQSTAGVYIEQLRDCITRHGGSTALIISHHNFSGTPAPGTLREILAHGIRLGADIVKIATFARTIEDNLTILNLISEATGMNRRIIAFCMGEKGRVSRVMAPLFGSFLSFASMEKGKESAPGQMTVEEMKEIGRMLQ